MDTVEIGMEPRQPGGTNVARRLRADGKVPAVLYGRKRGTEAIAVSAEEFDQRVSHLEGAHLIRLRPSVEGATPVVVLIREAQRHPVTGSLLHADFLEVDLTERIRVKVALHFVGRAVGVVAGGILQPIVREIEVECLPADIPEYVDVDVSALGIHEAVHVGSVQLPEGVRAVVDPMLTLVTVLPPTVDEAAPTPEAAAAPAKKPGGEG
jgi:large subunit ribosomal protein L25